MAIGDRDKVADWFAVALLVFAALTLLCAVVWLYTLPA